jgi:hypothetical protein
MTIKDILEKARMTKELKEQLAEELNKYTIKYSFLERSNYSKRTSYFIITNEGKAFEIPVNEYIDKEDVDISNRLYKDLIIDSIYETGKIRILGRKESMDKAFSKYIEIDSTIFELETKSKTILKMFSEARLKDILKRKRKELQTLIEYKTKEIQVLEEIKDMVTIYLDSFYSDFYKDEIFLGKNRVILTDKCITIGKKMINKKLPMDEIINKIKRIIIESQLKIGG